MSERSASVTGHVGSLWPARGWAWRSATGHFRRSPRGFGVPRGPNPTADELQDLLCRFGLGRWSAGIIPREPRRSAGSGDDRSGSR